MTAKIKLTALTVTALAIGVLGGFSVSSAAEQTETVPKWIQNVAGFWANGEVTDIEFVNAMEFLVDNGIMNLPNTINAAEAQTITSSLEEMEKRIERVETQQPTSTGQAIAPAPVPPDESPGGEKAYSQICPSEYIQHWDKIVFKLSPGTNFLKSSKDIPNTLIDTYHVIDIKIRETPSEVETFTNLKGRVLDHLENKLGFFETGAGAELTHSDIEIVDVEYAIICAYRPGAVESANPSTFK